MRFLTRTEQDIMGYQNLTTLQMNGIIVSLEASPDAASKEVVSLLRGIVAERVAKVTRAIGSTAVVRSNGKTVTIVKVICDYADGEILYLIAYANGSDFRIVGKDLR